MAMKSESKTTWALIYIGSIYHYSGVRNHYLIYHSCAPTVIAILCLIFASSWGPFDTSMKLERPTIA